MARAASPGARAALGLAAGAVLVAGGLALAAGAASEPSPLVPAARGGFPGWMAGPFAGLGLRASTSRAEVLLALMTVSYGVVLACSRALGPRLLLTTIVLAHVVFLLSPPLFSQDVFGYLDYARLGALHGLDPYTHASVAAPHDAVYRYVGWQHATSPYGPLFTLLSYALVPLGVPGGYWALKLVAAVAGIVALALLWRCSRRLGRDPRPAVALVGLNPVLLVFGVAGAHNELLLLALTAGAVALALSARPAGGAVAALTAAGLKASAGLIAPFLVLGSGRRGRAAAAALLAAGGLALIALVAFGTHATGFLDALRGQQHLVAIHSLPAQISRLFGSRHLSSWLRSAFAVAFVVALVGALWRTWRGANWLAGAGWATVALLVSTAWLLPWYVLWALPFAALAEDRRLRIAVLLLSAYLILTRMPVTDPLLNGVL